MAYAMATEQERVRMYAALQAVLAAVLGVGPIPSARRGPGGVGAVGNN